MCNVYAYKHIVCENICKNKDINTKYKLTICICSETVFHCVEESGLELRESPAPASRGLGLEAWVTTPGCCPWTHVSPLLTEWRLCSRLLVTWFWGQSLGFCARKWSALLSGTSSTSFIYLSIVLEQDFIQCLYRAIQPSNAAAGTLFALRL